MVRLPRLRHVLLVALVAAVLAPASSAADGRVESAFPAAGPLVSFTVTVRSAPSPRAPAVKVMRQFRPDYRRQEIFAVARRTGADGREWYRISVPGRPNGRMGWIPAGSVALAPTRDEIVVHRTSRRIEIFHGGRLVHQGVVAVGAPGMETPLGHYYVAARFVPRDPFLGAFAVETSAYSKLSEWPGGGVVGIHGTSLPQLLGQAVSHGCVRVSNRTAAALRRYAPLGTPIVITE